MITCLNIIFVCGGGGGGGGGGEWATKQKQTNKQVINALNYYSLIPECYKN